MGRSPGVPVQYRDAAAACRRCAAPCCAVWRPWCVVSSVDGHSHDSVEAQALFGKKIENCLFPPLRAATSLHCIIGYWHARGIVRHEQEVRGQPRVYHDITQRHGAWRATQTRLGRAQPPDLHLSCPAFARFANSIGFPFVLQLNVCITSAITPAGHLVRS